MVGRRMPGRRMLGGRPGQEGHILLIALIVILIAMTAAALVAANLTSRVSLLRDEQRDVKLQAFLDAGLARALSSLWADSDYEGGDEILGTPPASAEVVIDVLHLSGLEYRVTVQASYLGLRRSVVAMVRLSPDPDIPPRVLDWTPESHIDDLVWDT